MLGALLTFLPACAGMAVVFVGSGEDCSTLLYAETFKLAIGADTHIDLTTREGATATCSVVETTKRNMVIAFGNVTNEIQALSVSFSFSSTGTGYWNSKEIGVSYNDGDKDVNEKGPFTNADMISTYFSFACSLQSTTSINSTTDGGNVSVMMNNYQMQPYNVKDKFSAAVQCVNFISKGAWMGAVSALILLSVLIFSIIMLMSTSTPDRFETTKSKCLIIPHEH